MPPTLSAQEYVDKWRPVTLKERSMAQEQFIDLCHLVGHPTPAEYDPTGQTFCFEKGADKVSGGDGWADVWKKNYFGWEYKGPRADLDAAYKQLLLYRESLGNPPLLVVCDGSVIKIHTNFTNTVKRIETVTLDDLLTPHGLGVLESVFFNPNAFRSAETPETVTRAAAAEFGKLAQRLRDFGAPPEQAAHFLIRLLFCLFAEDMKLLPEGLFTRLVQAAQNKPGAFAAQLKQLFEAMATGGWFGSDQIVHINGGLFNDSAVLDLDADALRTLLRVCNLDWSALEPSILGTLFERSLDPGKRKQLGAHYTGMSDIKLIVEPVLMAPLRREWDEVRAQAQALAGQRDAAKGAARTKLQAKLVETLRSYAERLAQVKVLDPACGSGNFLYVSLRLLLDLWQEVSNLSATLGGTRLPPLAGQAPYPNQFHGLEINTYAHELAETTIWIGYLQWLHENGYGLPTEPVLQPMDTIWQMDAVLGWDAEGRPIEPEWPAADVIIGNPPFLGGSKIRKELGNAYTEALFEMYGDRLPATSDLVCYWHEKARAMIAAGKTKRVGLLATQGIRGGTNRRVLERIKESGDIFWAQSDRRWIIDGAAVRVAMVAFDNGDESRHCLDGRPVSTINPDLSTAVDVTAACPLAENSAIAFLGGQKIGPFDISAELAAKMLAAKGNPNGKPNSDVVRPSVNGADIMWRPTNTWIVDFGADLSEAAAAMYEMPFEYIREHVYPVRSKNRRATRARNWWLHGEVHPGMRKAIGALPRFIATSRVARRRVFVWLPSRVLPDYKLCVFARQDDYFFGVLQSKIHSLWSLRSGSHHGVGDDPVYTPTTTFETYPFPWPPGKEPVGDPRVEAITHAARELVKLRDAWLNPPDIPAAELKKRTLTNLYNKHPEWLQNAHRKLDEAVFAAYGWPANLSDEEILERLLALNLERAAKQ